MHKVKVDPNFPGEMLLGGVLYTAGVEHVLTDEQYAAIPSDLFTSNVLDDLGPVVEVSGSGTSTTVVRGPFRVVFADLPDDPTDPAAVLVPFAVGEIVRAMWMVEVTPYASANDPVTVFLGTLGDDQQFYVQLGTGQTATAVLANYTYISDGTDRGFYTNAICTAGEYDFYVEVIPASAYLA